MAENTNLSAQIARQLPAELVSFMQTAGGMAARQGQSLYLVGGVVRDLLLERTNLDLDLVVSQDATNLAQQLLNTVSGKLTTHSRFGTAKLRWRNWSVDLATARSETYERPGALPSVKPGSLADDLFRRDFTINAMAIELVPHRYGQLVDLYRGRDDLEHKLIRILHEKSFIDDATRIWRALRYEQRLSFQLETKTLELLRRDVSWLETISADRIRHELELGLREEMPEKILRRAKELKVLAKLQPNLKGDGWLRKRFERARQITSPNLPSVGLYLALLVYQLSSEETEKLISRLKLPRLLAQTLRDSYHLKTQLELLANPKLPPSRIYYHLHGYSATAIVANLLASEFSTIHQHIQTFLTRLRYVKPSLTGDDLQKMGIAPGPRMKEILQRIHQARLDGEVTSKKGEEEMVEGWIRRKGGSYYAERAS